MTLAATRPLSRLASVVRVFRIVRTSLRNPLDALPRSVYTQPILRSRLMGRDRVHVMAPALIHQALVGNAARLDKGRAVRRTLSPALGDGLLTAEGGQWRWQRQAIAPLFRPDRVRTLVLPMIEAAERCRDRLLAVPAGETVAIEHETMRTTFDIIVATMLSDARFDPRTTAQGVTDFVTQTNWSIVINIIGLPSWTPHPGRRRAAIGIKRMRGEIGAHVTGRRARYPDGRPGEPDLLDQLIAARDPETGRVMTDQEIADNLMTFLTAGHETTALGLAWCLDRVARNPEVAARIADEIARVTGGAPIAPEHVGGLSYLRQVFHEAMRLYPPAPMIAREVTEPFELDGAMLAVGTTLVVPIRVVHRHLDLWDEPDRFDPDRFAPEAEQARHRYAYLPFGAGPRVCIGAGFAVTEAVAILAVLLRDVRFEPGLAEPPAERMDLTLRPASPLLVRVSGIGRGAALDPPKAGPLETV